MNGLVLNPNKKEVIQMSTTRRDKELSPVKQINLAGLLVEQPGQRTLLGVGLDAAISFVEQIKNVCKASFCHIRALRHLRPSIPEGNGKLHGMLSGSIASGLCPIVIHRYVAGKRSNSKPSLCGEKKDITD